MRWMLVLLFAAACGGSGPEQSSAPAALAEAGAACDYCPGNISASVSGGMEFCPCPDGGRNSFIFRADPPLASCNHIQCEYAFWISHGCTNAVPGPDGGLVIAQCGP